MSSPQDRRARPDYLIEDTLEAGVVLQGTEVKVLRKGQASIAEAYADESGGELFLVNANIPEYASSAHFNHEPRRPRKLLLHRRENEPAARRDPARKAAVVPLSIYFNARGRARDRARARPASKTRPTSARPRRRAHWQRSAPHPARPRHLDGFPPQRVATAQVPLPRPDPGRAARNLKK